MAQPDYVPVGPADRVRQTERLPPARRWTSSRPGEIVGLRPPTGASFGSPGPDQGFALKLARRFEQQLVLVEGEHAEDAMRGCVAVATKRASIFGRAPTIYDLEHAFALFGFLADAPAELVRFRRQLFQAAAHDYWDQRAVADSVPEETLRLAPSAVRERLVSWEGLLRPEAGQAGADGDVVVGGAQEDRADG